jgi:pyridoxamine 5'-phosphate oxidase
MNDLSDYRKNYQKSELTENVLPEAPMELFHTWFLEAEKMEQEIEVNAMTLSTVQPDGFPKGRIVLLKEYTPDGFVFYTNYESEKGRSMQANNKVCLSFFWPNSERQVLIIGNAEKVAPEVSDAYFASRPRGSQLGAWASAQSTEISGRQFIDDKLAALELEFEGKEIPRPPHWGGFLVTPVSMEFWQGRANRLHDRIRYTRSGEGWVRGRLSP